MMRKAQTLVGLFAVVLFIWSSTISAAPKAQLIPFWNASNEANSATIDHSAWQTILNRYLVANHPSGVSRFNYAKLTANTADGNKLDEYLSYLQKLDPRTYSKAEQKAYWINFYNALTIQVVLSAYPVSSITKIYDGWFGFGPWDDVHAKVAGQRLTLNDIEHGILRPIWKNDNRIHYAVNCASYGCPNLASEAYTAANMDRLLEQGARDYVNHPRGVQFKSDGTLLVSSIYRWYKRDFGGTNASVIRHWRQYAKPRLAKRLWRYNGPIDHDYNWSLNAN
ncbi:MAG: Ser/Thr protein kinase [Candidatus Parabeggiatoa sp. nov. 2]|nr:MAG: hypothetical protein B6247_24890 [Beggiatoa sp. 4572_84]RKZ57182.1 MAG: Ser/Thr protein kinase [Gammaproteobacteria bacterium]